MAENPPAFPVAEVRIDGIGFCEGSPGMTLRDWFAGQVIGETIRLAVSNDGSWEPENVAYHAYLVADALLVERAKLPLKQSAPAPEFAEVEPAMAQRFSNIVSGTCTTCGLAEAECDCLPF